MHLFAHGAPSRATCCAFVTIDAAGDRRLHADAVQQRLRREQPRHRAGRTCRRSTWSPGICTIFVGPLVGKAADKFGKFRVFAFGSALSIVMVLIYTHLGPMSLPVVDRRQRGDVRRHLLAHDPVPGAGRRWCPRRRSAARSTRSARRSSRCRAASRRWSPATSSRTAPTAARALSRGRLRRRRHHAGDNAHHVEGEAGDRAAGARHSRVAVIPA